MSAFKACDIRGKFPEELDEALFYRIGRAARAISTSAHWEREVVVVAGDVRTSTPLLLEALERGLLESGATVIDLGVVPTPVAYFAKERLGVHGLFIVTASHNPPGYNGLKLMLGDEPVVEDEMRCLEEAVKNLPEPAKCPGRLRRVPMMGKYSAWLRERFSNLSALQKEPPLKVVVDAGNGCLSSIAPETFGALSFSVERLFCEEDGSFPGRLPNPAATGNLTALSQKVQEVKADLGVAFDGDGDRVGLVDETSEVVLPEEAIILLMRKVFHGRRGEKFVYDQKASEVVAEECNRLKGIALPERSGYAYIRRRMMAEEAIFGAEISGHYFYRELGGRDDGLFSALLFAEILLEERKKLSEMRKTVPAYFITPDLRLRLSSEEARTVMERVKRYFPPERVRLLDGVRVSTHEGWGLLRQSITEPVITLRFEAKSEEGLSSVAEEILQPVPDVAKRVLAMVREDRRT